MATRLILTVTCANDCVSSTEYPGTFVLEVDDLLKARILELAQAVSDLDVLTIEEFCYEGNWVKKEFEASNLSEFLKECTQYEADVENPCLHVANGRFYFTACPKHAGDDLALTTAHVPIAELEKGHYFS